jgi:uncharacterized protein (DUF885 family)
LDGGRRRRKDISMPGSTRFSLLAAATLALSSGLIDASDAARAAPVSPDELMEAYFEEYLELYPLTATSIGDHRYDDRYTVSISPEFRARALAMHRRYLEAARKIDPAGLDEQDRVSLEIFLWDRERSVEVFGFPDHLMPINQQFSATNSFVRLGSGSSYQPFRTVRDYENWLSRMDGFIAWTDQAIANMREGMKRDVVLPRILIERIIPQLDSQVPDDVRESPLFAPVENMPASFSEEDRTRLTALYTAAIRDALIPAYARLRDFVAGEYLAAGRETAGYGDLPDGAAWYDHRVRRNTTTELTAEEIHRIGLAEVEKIHGEMRTAVIDKVDFDGDLDAFFEFMNSDPRFYLDEPGQLLDGFRALREPVRRGTIPLFHRFPTLDYEIRAIEAFREQSGPSAHYQSPDPDGSRPGVFYVNTYDLSARPSWAMESLFLHEAIPGHHFQNALRIETLALPRYRRFSGYVAYGEGWALYSETLGEDVGVYTDPYQYFGTLSAQLWRAIRLVVDTGIHHKGWTRQQVLEYMYANAPVKPTRAISEAERYMANPGQALGYKIGQLKILELRARAQAALREDFDIRDFHAVMLDAGPLPLAVLEQRTDRWIAAGGGGAVDD